MILVNVTRVSDGQLGWRAMLETQQEADAFVSQNEANNSWGRLARQVKSTDQSINTEDITKATSAVEMSDGNGAVYTLYSFGADFIVAFVDVTAQVTNANLVQKGLQAQQIGAQVIAQVYAFNEANLSASKLTTQQFEAMLGDQSLLNIERLLWNGSLATALALINANVTALETYFSSDQVTAIVAMITNSGLV